MLPFLAFLGHNAVYLLAGFLCFCWLKPEEEKFQLHTTGPLGRTTSALYNPASSTLGNGLA